MPDLLADANIEGFVDYLVRILEGPDWSELWTAANCRPVRLADLGLPSSTPDDRLWRICQDRGLVLITANRNHHGDRSLQGAIEAAAGSDHLPVLTLGDTDRILKDRQYADRVAERLLDTLLNLDNFRGSGRLYLP